MSGEEKQKIHLVSLGCPKNTVDSERMLGLLRAVVEREFNDGGDWWGKLPWQASTTTGG